MILRTKETEVPVNLWRLARFNREAKVLLIVIASVTEVCSVQKQGWKCVTVSHVHAEYYASGAIKQSH